MELIDTHCHLQFPKLYERLDEVMAGAEGAGVKRMISVGTTLADSAKSLAIVEKLDNAWASAGVHPHDAKGFMSDKGGPAKLKDLLNKSSIIAVGEIGLDYFKDYCPRDVQKQALRSQIEASLSSGLPYIFHVREAWDDFWPIIDEYKIGRGVIHSFSAGAKELDEILARGFMVGLNGIMTFTKDEKQLEAAKKVPLGKLVLETDAPFLAPVPFRGQTCEPKHVRTTAQFLADLRGEPLEKLALATTTNALKLFGLGDE